MNFFGVLLVIFFLVVLGTTLASSLDGNSDCKANGRDYYRIRTDSGLVCARLQVAK